MLIKGLAVLAVSGVAANASDWSQGRGWNRDAIADSRALTEWPPAAVAAGR